jgi:hypothetical protein
MGQGGFSQTGRAVEENVIEGFAPAFGGLDPDPEIGLQPFLSDIIIQGGGAQTRFETGILLIPERTDLRNNRRGLSLGILVPARFHSSSRFSGLSVSSFA